MGYHMNKTLTDTHMQTPDHTRLPTYTHTHMIVNTRKNMRVVIHTYTNVDTYSPTYEHLHTHMHAHTSLVTHLQTTKPSKYTQTRTNTLARERACRHTHYTQAHTYASCACICNGRHYCTHTVLLLCAHHHSPLLTIP
jgi:hypothetical protein